MNRCVKVVKVCVTGCLQDNVNSKNNVTPSILMNQFMLLFIGGSISPTEFKVSYLYVIFNIVIKLPLLELCPLLERATNYILSCV